MVCLYHHPLVTYIYSSFSFHISIPWNWVCMYCNYYTIVNNRICYDSTRIVVRHFLLVILLISKKHRLLVSTLLSLEMDLFPLLYFRRLQVCLRCLFDLSRQTTKHPRNPRKNSRLDPIMVCFLSFFDLSSFS